MADKEKPKPPTIEELEANGMTPWKPCFPEDTEAHWGGPSDLYNKLLGFFQSWVYHPDPRIHHVLTAWTLSTWQYRKFRSSPPLFLLGPVKSGKTTILECLEQVAYRGIRGGSMSASTMFRLSESFGPSFLVDESQIYNREEFAECQALLNERYREGGMVWRTEATETGFVPRGFHAFGPTALAGSEQSWEALVSRAVTVNMEKGRPTYRTGTPTFKREGIRFRVWLRVFENSDFSHNSEELDPELEKLDDGRLIEKLEPLLACAFTDQARTAILSYGQDLQRKQEANEETSYLVEYLQAYFVSQQENGKVSAKEIRVQLATLRGVDLKDKSLPTTRRVLSCMDTLGFERTRMINGDSGVLSNSQLEERLKKRYRLGEYSVPSESSAKIEKIVLEPNEPNEPNEPDEATEGLFKYQQDT